MNFTKNNSDVDKFLKNEKVETLFSQILERVINKYENKNLSEVYSIYKQLKENNSISQINQLILEDPIIINKMNHLYYVIEDLKYMEQKC